MFLAGCIRCRLAAAVTAALLVSTHGTSALAAFGAAPSWGPRLRVCPGAGRQPASRSGAASAHAGPASHGTPSQAIWSSRRGLLAGASTASIASVLLHATGASADAHGEGSWLARPDERYERARQQLAREAEAAALLVTPAVREAFRRDGVAVVRGAVARHWIESLRQGCELAQVSGRASLARMLKTTPAHDVMCAFFFLSGRGGAVRRVLAQAYRHRRVLHRPRARPAPASLFCLRASRTSGGR